MGLQPLRFRTTVYGTQLVLDINIHTAPLLFLFPLVKSKPFIPLDIMG